MGLLDRFNDWQRRHVYGLMWGWWFGFWSVALLLLGLLFVTRYQWGWAAVYLLFAARQLQHLRRWHEGRRHEIAAGERRP